MASNNDGSINVSLWEHVKLFEKDLRDRLAKSEAENAELRRKVALSEELERENNELREDLRNREADLTKYESKAGVTWEEHQRLLQTYQALETKYKNMKVQATHWSNASKTWKQRFETCRERYDRIKEEVKRWQAYADGCDERYAIKQRAKSGTPSAALRTPVADLNLRMPTPRLTSLTPARDLSEPQTSANSSPPPIVDDPSRSASVPDPISKTSARKGSKVDPELKDGEATSAARDNAAVSRKKSPASRASAGVRRIPVKQVQVKESTALHERHHKTTSRSPDHVETTSTASRTLAGSTEVIPPQIWQKDGPSDILARDVPAPTIEQQTPFVPPTLISTQSTEGETVRECSTPAAETHYHLLADDDEPEVISTRILRPNKRKRTTTATENHESAPVRIKTEPLDGGITHEFVQELHPNQSIEDLDTIPGTVLTPRKYRQLQRLRSNSQGRLNYAGRPPPSLNQLRSSSLPTDPSPEEVLRGSFEQELRGSAPASAGIRVKADAGEPVVDSSDGKSVLNSGTPVPKGHAHVLQPLSSNTRAALPRTSERTLNKRQKHEHTLAANIDALAEDGGRQGPDDSEDAQRQISPSFRTPRIRDMLEVPSARKPALANTPLSRKRPVSRDTPVTVLRAGKTPALVVKDTYEGEDYDTRPEDEPLRLKPVGSLTLNDFKINPKYNHGLDYAFSEVIRNKDERRCLPGCTKPDCCGNSFRKVIEIGGALAGPAPGLWDNNEDLEADQRLLEQYLGTDAQNRLRRMTTEQKLDMLKEAQIERAAQMHGRHKAAFARRATPPGFWDADFPSTQEEEENRRKAQKLEEEKIQERYYEAMRGGGRWMFKDE